MSQHHPGRRRRAALLTPALVGGLVLASGTPVLAATPNQTQPAQAQPAPGAKQKTYSAGIYFVQLADQPVATDPATAAKPGARLNTATDAVRDLVRHLKQQRDKVLDAVDGVKPLYSYQLLLNGFAAKLTAAQASELARTPGVLTLTRNVMSHPLATTTPQATGTLPAADTADFLGLKKPGGLYSKVPGGQLNAGAGMILGDLDTGIDTANPSFAAFPGTAPGQAAVNAKWKGTCDPGQDPAHRVTCNNKVIGAQYFNKSITDPKPDDWPSPLDGESHGTHTASTAAGKANVAASVPDSGISGTKISGLAPAARIAAYRVCYTDGCGTVDIVAAMEKAVADGVDVINYSLGGPNTDHANRPEYLAMLNAARAGVFVSASAGNSGPGTASNGVPWVTTVAASSHSIGYQGTVTLGNGKAYHGVSIAGSGVPSAPLVDAAKAVKSGADAANAALCMPDTLDPAKVKGAIVVCARGNNARTDKSAQVKAAGGLGMVLYNTLATDEEIADAHTVPGVHLNKADGEAVKAYADGSGATAVLAPARAVRQEAPVVAGFSSSGPDLNSGGDLLKPDITAPGVDIVAGVAPGTPGFTGQQGIMSGTSMSAPHVSGLALVLRQLHPTWTPMEVKSALMTTATTKDSAGKPIQRAGGTVATPLDYGSGHVVPTSAADPGLVYNSTAVDWVAYLCSIGQAPVLTDGRDICAVAPKIDPSDLNTPSISVGDLAGAQTVTRTVTNVSGSAGTYTASVETPAGYKATVSPAKLTVKPGRSASYKVTFTRTTAAYGKWAFGAVSWADGHHKVRSAVALRAAQVSAASSVTGKGASGSVRLAPKAGFAGTFTTAVNGLYAGTTKTGTLKGAGDVNPAQPGPNTAASTFTVPAGTALARLAIVPSDFKAGSDVDLWVVDKDGNVVSSPGAGNNEHVDLAPGTYDVYVNQAIAPAGSGSQTYKLHTWLIGKTGKPAPKATATPASQKVKQGAVAKSTVSWKGLKAGNVYLGLVSYGDGRKTIGTTALTVTP
ncbi:peptidase [Streptomyces sp. V2]|uniref:S8 family serine peptidase n=1 Tax=Streptomyces sp. V2 TaxID=1424099 RepID=UPI000D66B86F|nr:S8 family serine peptidase [Streptomyces sp. V2]PWG07209.1 peptidase [Streptomyces sp. V2]